MVEGNLYAGTTAVVTGASSGIGRAVAIALAGRGVRRIVVHYRENQSGAEQTKKLLTDLGCEATIIAADLNSPEHVSRFVRSVWKTLGDVQTWINNAGADVLTGVASELSFEDKLCRLLEVDVIGTIRLSRLVAERMRSQTLTTIPSITFIGWDQAPDGMEGDAGQMFGPVKAAVMAFANSLAQTLAPKVRVNTVAPGWIQTAWGQATSDYWDTRAKTQALMNRWGKPEDVAAAVAFAADPSNTFLTGQTIEINGGWSRRFEGGEKKRPPA